MLSRRLALALVACAALASVQSAPAAAAGEPDSGAFNAFQARGSNGYRILALAGSGKGYRHGQVLLLVDGRRGSVSYFAPARVTDTTVQADLGELGTIDLTFQPSGREGVAAPVCERSQRARYERGDYVGTFDFRGEEGFTRANAVSLPYSPHPFIDFICPGYSRGELVGRDIRGARLRARLKTGTESVSLQVNQNRPGARVEVSAAIDERSGRVRISREIQSDYSARAFDLAGDLAAASLSPSSPFSGSALYLRGAKRSNRWTGNLAVDFPGHSNVPLTGARFDTTLVHAHVTEDAIQYDRLWRPNLTWWPSTKPSPIAFATPSLLASR